MIPEKLHSTPVGDHALLMRLHADEFIRGGQGSVSFA